MSQLDYASELDAVMREFFPNLTNGVESADAKISRLEGDRNNLTLQVSVLSEQVDAQKEKIHDLEASLRSKIRALHGVEHMLDKELLNRTSLETHKLDLMAEISALKLRLATSEKERRDMEEKYVLSQKRIDDLQSRLNERTIELTEVRAKLLRNGTIHAGNADTDAEVERLKKAVETLMITNEEKDQQLEDMKKKLRRYRKIEEVVTTAHAQKGQHAGLHDLLFMDEDQTSDHSSSTQHSASSTSGAGSAGTSGGSARGNEQQTDKLEIVETSDIENRQQMPTPNATSTPVGLQECISLSHHSEVSNGSRMYTPPSTITQTPVYHKPPIARSNSLENLATPVRTKTPPTVRRRVEGTGTLPREMERVQGTMPKKKAQTEAEEEALKDEMAQRYKALQSGDRMEPKKKRGFKRFLGRIKRSNSQDFDEPQPEDFKRNGLRSTTGPRLGWSKDLKYTDIDVPFARWDCDRVTWWLHSMGLSMYVGECKRWVKNGDQLLKASSHDLEKEMGIRNSLHRKKLQLALQAIGSESKEPMDNLDHNWVTRWLDDIGLPQYKDSFSDARIDGRMLHYLTVDDLSALKVTNALHHLSIKRGIQALRSNNFNPTCLKRRPVPDEGQLSNCPREVLMWTNHRVMEWLRTIDLSEYAPNLRGSGVHGALMVLEPKFTAELFAALLSIPASKTLLRRHLNTHFVTLVGSETQQTKRQAETQPGYVPLTPNQKIKLKRGIFSHKRTRSIDHEDYVCPLDPQVDRNANGTWRKDESLSRSHTVKDQKAAKEIGVYSNEIDTLTTMLAKENFLDDVPTSNV